MSSGSAACVQARNYSSRVEVDPTLARLVWRIERRFDQEREGQRGSYVLIQGLPLGDVTTIAVKVAGE